MSQIISNNNGKKYTKITKKFISEKKLQKTAVAIFLQTTSISFVYTFLIKPIIESLAKVSPLLIEYKAELTKRETKLYKH